MPGDFSGNSYNSSQHAANPLNIDSHLSISTDLLNPFSTKNSLYGSSSSILESKNIATGSTFIDNSGSNFIGDPNKPWDDAFIYANRGVVFNGNPTLSPLPGALVIGPDGTVDKLTGMQYSRSFQSLTIERPAYDELLAPALVKAPSITELVFNSSQQPLNTYKDVTDAIKSNDNELSVVRVVNGGLNLPTGSRLHNLVITVENGDINFNGDAQELNYVTLVAKNGNVNLGGVKATEVSVFASGLINMNNAARFSGKNLLATKDGSVIFNGSTVTTNPSDSVLVVANGNIIFNAAADTRANFLASGSFTANSASKIIGSIQTQGDIIFNAPIKVIADNVINPNQPAIAIIDTGMAANNPDFDHRRLIPLKDYVDNDNNPFLNIGEGSEHGTHIAGIIAATKNNGIGIDGINDKAPIFVSRAIGSGNWAQALIDSVNATKLSGQPNTVVNLALDLTQVNPDGTVTTRYELTPVERQALEYARQKGVLIVAAAGNDGSVMSALGQASQEFDNIITVGSVDYNNKRANYSSFGYGLDIVAYGGTTDKPVISTVGSGTNLKFLIEGLDGLANNTEGSFKSVVDVTSSNLTDINTVVVPSFEISDDLSDIKQQAYESALKEVSEISADGLNFSSDKLTDEERAMLASQVNLEKLLGEFKSFLDTLPLDFFDVLNNPEFAGLLALLEKLDTTSNEELDSGVGEMAGTSVATAKVTGAVSQIWAANPVLNYVQVKEILKKTAVDLEAPGWDEETGAGLLNSAAAIELAEITQPESYEPEAFSTPITWSGEGVVQPTERAASNEFIGKYYDWVPYTIQSGDTLSEIASGAMGNGSAPYYNFIARKNDIANPNQIYAGKTILVPKQVSVLQLQPQTSTLLTVQGGIRLRWLQNLWLGAPTSGEIGRGNGVITQYFANGYVIWNGQRATAYRIGNPTSKTLLTAKPNRIPKSFLSSNQQILSSAAAAKQFLSRTVASAQNNIHTNIWLQQDRLLNSRYINKVKSTNPYGYENPYRPTDRIDVAADAFTGNYLFGPTVCGVAPNRDAATNNLPIPYSSWNPLWNQQQTACAVHDYQINKTGKDPIKDWTDPGIIKAHANLSANSPSSNPLMKLIFGVAATGGAIGYGGQKLGEKSKESYEEFNRRGADMMEGVIKWAYPNYPS
ncbi:S8 family serine peptidase [Brunnivagina elsteri]|uniref:LysM domain-containing protein n=1 Tax=Brunnivagina elsteri CCALA 953 TaxID=987040 RepID=A0A2A2TP83_9CYAN|nr:S8 family serine peptidase [Calothrix elsteri]PAX60242.1 hypothetical protein CK510_02890 [Calothrix elsteri CCALA 953]